MAATNTQLMRVDADEPQPGNTWAATVAAVVLGVTAAIFLCSRHREHVARAQIATVQILVVPPLLAGLAVLAGAWVRQRRAHSGEAAY